MDDEDLAAQTDPLSALRGNTVNGQIPCTNLSRTVRGLRSLSLGADDATVAEAPAAARIEEKASPETPPSLSDTRPPLHDTQWQPVMLSAPIYVMSPDTSAAQRNLPSPVTSPSPSPMTRQRYVLSQLLVSPALPMRQFAMYPQSPALVSPQMFSRSNEVHAGAAQSAMPPLPQMPSLPAVSMTMPMGHPHAHSHGHAHPPANAYPQAHVHSHPSRQQQQYQQQQFAQQPSYFAPPSQYPPQYPPQYPAAQWVPPVPSSSGFRPPAESPASSSGTTPFHTRSQAGAPLAHPTPQRFARPSAVPQQVSQTSRPRSRRQHAKGSRKKQFYTADSSKVPDTVDMNKLTWTAANGTVQSIKGSVAALACSQIGSRTLQQHSRRSRHVLLMVLREVAPCLQRLSTDIFANYLVQDVISLVMRVPGGGVNLLLQLAMRLSPEAALQVCCHMHGTRVVQKLIQCLPPHLLKSTLGEEEERGVCDGWEVSFAPGSIELTNGKEDRNLFGLEHLPERGLRVLTTTTLRRLCYNVHGSYVVKALMTYVPLPWLSPLFDVVLSHVCSMASDQQGLTVVKALIAMASAVAYPHHRCSIAFRREKKQLLTSRATKLLSDFYERNGIAFNSDSAAHKAQIARIVEHEMREFVCKESQRRMRQLLAKLVATLMPHVSVFVQNDFANYVLQTMAEVMEEDTRKRLHEHLRGQYVTLARHKHSSNVVDSLLRHSETVSRSIVDELVFYKAKKRGRRRYQVATQRVSKMLQHQYANYVVQNALNRGTPLQHAILSTIIEDSCKRNGEEWGEAVVSKWTRLLQEAKLAQIEGGVDSSARHGHGSGNAYRGRHKHHNKPRRGRRRKKRRQ